MNRVDSSRFEILGLVADSEDKRVVSEYLESVECDSLRIAMVPPSEMVSYKLTRTPITLLVSNEGKVEKAWIGLWDEKSLDDVASILGITFNARSVK